MKSSKINTKENKRKQGVLRGRMLSIVLNLQRPVNKRKDMHRCLCISDLSESALREVVVILIYFFQKKKPRLRVAVSLL